MSKRTQRRHHRERMVARARWVQKLWWGGREPHEPEKVERAAVRLADNIKVCSCLIHGCGNVRRCGGYQGPVLTRQERLAELHLQEEARNPRLEKEEEPVA